MVSNRLRTDLAEAIESEQKAWIAMHSSKGNPSVVLLDRWIEAVERLNEAREAVHPAGRSMSFLGELTTDQKQAHPAPVQAREQKYFTAL